MNQELKDRIIELIVDNATEDGGANPMSYVQSGDGTIYVDVDYRMRFSLIVCDVHLVAINIGDDPEVLLTDDQCYEIQTAANEKIVTPWFS